MIDVAINRSANVGNGSKPFRTQLNQELEMLMQIKALAEKVTINGKTKELLTALKKTLPYLKQRKLPQKAVIFTTYRITQDLLYKFLSDKGFKTLIYNGANSRDHTIMEQFRNDKSTQILIATDGAAKGLD